MSLTTSVKSLKRLKKNCFRQKKDVSFINFKLKKLTNRKAELINSIKSANYYLAGAGETDLLEALILADEAAELTAGLQIISRVNSKLFEMVEELSNVETAMDTTKAEILLKKSRNRRLSQSEKRPL